MKTLSKLTMFITLFVAVVGGFFGFAVHAAEKTLLIQAKSDAQDVMDTQDTSPVGDPFYLTDSYTAFIDAITALGGMDGIQAVIDDELATEQEVADLTTDINTAIEHLITSDTYYTTNANFSLAKVIDLTPYTSDSQLLYNNEMDRIEAILNDPIAGDAAISALNDDIDAAASTFLVPRGDKTDLLSLKSSVETIYASDGSDYIPSTFNDFTTAVENIDTLLLSDIGLTLQQLVDDIDAIESEVLAGETRLNNALSILILKPDKTALETNYTEAINIDGDLYTSSSFAIFEAGLPDILDVINDEEALQADVDQAISDLADLYNELVERADVSDLIDAYNLAVDKPLDSYTPDSIELYQAELARINTIIQSDDTDQAEADQALTDIGLAGDLLILQADRSQLQALNNLVIVAYYEERLLYTESSYQNFKNAVDDYGSYLYVNSVVVDDNVSQSTVDDLTSTLENALALLVPLADNGDLLVAYYEAISTDTTAYTTNSIAAYNAELERIYDLMTGKEFDAEAKAQAIVDMAAASTLLVSLPDFSELQTLYDTTDIYREEDYSITSYGFLAIAKENASDVIGNGNANQDMVVAAIDLLQTAIDSLVQKAEKIYITEGHLLDLNEYVTLGNSSVTSYYADDDTVVGIDSVGELTGLNYGETQVYIQLANGLTEILDIHVKAKVNTAVFVLTFSIPAVSIGLGFSVVYVKKSTWSNIWKAIKLFFKKK